MFEYVVDDKDEDEDKDEDKKEEQEKEEDDAAAAAATEAHASSTEAHAASTLVRTILYVMSMSLILFRNLRSAVRTGREGASRARSMTLSVANSILLARIGCDNVMYGRYGGPLFLS